MSIHSNPEGIPQLLAIGWDLLHVEPEELPFTPTSLIRGIPDETWNRIKTGAGSDIPPLDLVDDISRED